MNVQKLNYSILETAYRLGVGRGTVYNLIATGELKVVKIGKRTIVPGTEIDAAQERLLERKLLTT